MNSSNKDAQLLPLAEIVSFHPNKITAFRILLLMASIAFFRSENNTDVILLAIVGILDYVDGFVARKFNQCTFLGDAFDWIADMSI